MLEIQVEESDDYTVCRPVGELDAYTVGQFRESLAELATSQPAAHRPVGRAVHGLRRPRRADRRHPPRPRSGRRRRRRVQPPDADPAAAHHRFDRIVPVTETVERGRRARHRRRDDLTLASHGDRCAEMAALHGAPATGDAVRRRGARRPRRGRRGRARRCAGTAPGRPGAGATCSARPARCSSSRDATSRKSARLRVEPAEVGAVERPGPLARRLGEPVAEPRVHPVDDQRPHRRCRPRPAAGRRTSASSTVSRRGDATSTNAVRGSRQQLEHDVGPLLEALLHALEGREERDGVVEHVGADDLRHRAHERLRGDVDRLHDARGSAP